MLEEDDSIAADESQQASLDKADKSAMSFDDVVHMLARRVTDDSKKDPSASGEQNDESENETESEQSNETAETEQPEIDSTESATKDETKPTRRKASDDDEVEVSIDGKTETVPVKNLKRLFGQEASLTQKSQEIAEVRKAYEAKAQSAAMALQVAAEAAASRLKQFENNANWNWAQAQRDVIAGRMTAEQYSAVEQAFAQAMKEHQYFTSELTRIQSDQANERQRLLQQQAQSAYQILTSSPDKGGIEGFNRDIGDQISQYAIKKGVSKEVLSTMLDPALIKMAYQSMKYEELKNVATQKAKPVVKAPTKAVSSRETLEAAPADSTRSAFAKLRMSGSADDAAAVFAARMMKNRS